MCYARLIKGISNCVLCVCVYHLLILEEENLKINNRINKYLTNKSTTGGGEIIEREFDISY